MTPQSFYQCVRDYNDKFENIYFFITRDIGAPESVFDNSGRVHNRTESLEKEKQQRAFLDQWGVQYTDINVTSSPNAEDDCALQIYNTLLAQNWFKKD